MTTDLVEEAFVNYSADVYRFLLRRTGSHSDAEELTQQVFADAASSISCTDPPRSMRGWLFVVAERRLVDELRRRRRAAEIASALVPERYAEDDAPDELEEAVCRLPASQRRIVVMRIVEGRSYGEIARELRCSEAACKMRLSRALQRLRGDLRATS